MDAYPRAKVILTVREPERWYASMMQTVYPAIHDFPIAWLRHVIPGLRQVTKMQDCVIWDGIFHGRATDKAYAVSVYQQHIDAVTRTVPAERLLVYDVRQGWSPLCAFLAVAVPAQPFPRVNDGATFRRRLRTAQTAVGAAAVAILCGAWWAWRRNRKNVVAR